jgi:hypothetical protein
MSDSKGGAGGMGMNMVTTVMAFSVSAFFVLFVFTRLLCARLHLSRAAAAAAAQGYNVRRPPDPTHPAVLCTYLSIHPAVLFDGDRATRGFVWQRTGIRIVFVWACRWSAGPTAWSRPW